MQTIVDAPRSRKHVLWDGLQTLPKKEGVIEWSSATRDTLVKFLGGDANALTVQTLLYEMEQRGYIQRTRTADGRTVRSIALISEPPARANARAAITNGKAYAKPTGDIYAEVVEITPEQAMEWLDLNTHNRTLRQQFVERLAQAIKRGEWRLNGESIKINETDLVDGQHRLWAIVTAEQPVKSLVTYNVPMEAQETIDTGIKRTLSDMLRLRGEKDYSTLAATLVQMHIWQTRGQLGLTGAFYPTPQQAMAILQQHPEIRESAAVGKHLSDRIRYPAGIGAVIHWILNQIDPEDAVDFFNRLASGNNLDQDHPILVLRNQLAEMLPIHGAERPKIAALTIKAWNFYRNGMDIKRLTWKPGGAKPEAFPVPK